MAESETRWQAVSFQVRDYMTADPQTLDVQGTLLDAVLLLRRAELRHIPITENGRLAGILTDRDVNRYAPSILTPLSPQEYNRVFEETSIAKVMTRNPMSISPDVPLADAVDMLFRNRLGCLPVLEEDRLVGIITVSDMLRALNDLIGGSPSPDSLPERG